jgi:hypothetical protein
MINPAPAHTGYQIAQSDDGPFEERKFHFIGMSITKSCLFLGAQSGGTMPLLVFD